MTKANASAWADLAGEGISELIQASEEMGWRNALESYASDAPFFVKRMKNLGLVNWHVLLGRRRSDRVLDVGSGLGSATLGLGHYYQEAVGLEFLPDRVTFSSLRARQDGLDECNFLRGDGHKLPFLDGAFDLVTLNGVLEWAAYYNDERSVTATQQRMLRDIRRVLAPGGQIAIAIENRFAAESLAGMDDTHTHLKGVTFVPRWIANLWTRLRKGEEYRTWLYSQNGYQRLIRAAGFEHVRIFDLVSSYNDYDFVLDTEDTLSYELLYRHDLVRGFYRRADRLRAALHRMNTKFLAKVSYAYLVVAGVDAPTLIDPSHPIWAAAAQWEVHPGKARFAMNGKDVGSLVLVAHDGRHPTGLVEVGLAGPGDHEADEPAHLGVRAIGSTGFQLAGSGSINALRIRAFRPTSGPVAP